MPNKHPKSTRKQRKENNRKLEMSKRAIAHSKPLFNPRESWSPRLKVGGVPVATLDNKEHHARYCMARWYSFHSF
jgi:hypothetical protein